MYVQNIFARGKHGFEIFQVVVFVECLRFNARARTHGVEKLAIVGFAPQIVKFFFAVYGIRHFDTLGVEIVKPRIPKFAIGIAKKLAHNARSFQCSFK